MPLGSLDRDPPPFFRQGPSALSRLIVYSALATFLMVADVRFKIMKPVRLALATAVYPVQWLAMQPQTVVERVSDYFVSLTALQRQNAAAHKTLARQAQRSQQVEQLLLENARLRQLLDLRGRPALVGSKAAQVIYDAADPFTRKVVIDKGLMHGVREGSPVLDALGVLGQITRVHPAVSEVTLVSDPEHAIPVLNTRTGVRGVAFGDDSTHADGMELRFMSSNADVAVGDLLTTSGVDGVYPPGLAVAKVVKVERPANVPFARVHCMPVALVGGATHVMVLDWQDASLPERPLTPAATGALPPAAKERAP